MKNHDPHGQNTMRELRRAHKTAGTYGARHLAISPVVMALGILGIFAAIVILGGIRTP